MQLEADRFSWFDVPEQVKALLIQAAASWENTQESERYIHQALQITDNNINVLVAAYRFFYYKHNYQMALQMAQNVIDVVRAKNKFPESFQSFKSIVQQNPEDEQVRLYLNAYSAYGLILAKLGERDTAKKICEFIQEIDVNKEYLSAEILLDILTRPPEDDED